MIKKLDIHDFRFIKDQQFLLGKNITVFSGHNATGKSTILGLLGHCAQYRGSIKPIVSPQFRTEYEEIFNFSIPYDKTSKKHMTFTVCEYNNLDNETETFYYRSSIQKHMVKDSSGKEKETERYRLLPRRQMNGRWSAQKLECPTLYLGLSRLYPIGETSSLVKTKFRKPLSAEDNEDLAKNYNRILCTEYEIRSIDPLKADINEVCKNAIIGVTTDEFDFSCNSAGQTNLGQILLAIKSFEKLNNALGEAWDGGLLLIDELDATLHPIAQIRLFDYFMQKSNELELQICFTTHSLSLLEHISEQTRKNTEGVNNSVELVYITRANGPIEFWKNPSYDAIMYDLTMTMKKESTEKVKIYTEDDEAKWFLERLLINHLDRINVISLGLGCDELIKLYKQDDYFQNSALVALDGDAKQKLAGLRSLASPWNIFCLPADNLSPEALLYNFLKENTSEYLSDCWDPGHGTTYRNIMQYYPLSDNSNKDNREKYKAWFQKLKTEKLEFLKNLVLAWCNTHPTKQEAFLTDFKRSFNIIAHKKYMPTID